MPNWPLDRISFEHVRVGSAISSLKSKLADASTLVDLQENLTLFSPTNLYKLYQMINS